jgi:hypothetical protein
MKLKDIEKIDKIKKESKKRILLLQEEIDILLMNKSFAKYDENRDIIGNATALSDVNDEIKEIIFNFLSENYEDEIISLNKEMIKTIRRNMLKRIKQF